jgi:hypothetical protein
MAIPMRGQTAVLPRRTHAPTGLLLAAAAIGVIALAALALGYVVYTLWPRWPDAPVQADAPALPIIIGDVLFRVPQAAIRRKVQRRAGVQERIDLAYVWPTLEPSAPGSGANVDPAISAAPRLFVNIATAPPTALTPAERLKTIYPRYIEGQVWVGPPGLAAVAFRADTPYRGEELFYDAAAPDRFVVRCTKTVGVAPGSCLYERFIGSADITVRFSREWLDDWRAVLAGIDDVINHMEPAGH